MIKHIIFWIIFTIICMYIYFNMAECDIISPDITLETYDFKGYGIVLNPAKLNNNSTLVEEVDRELYTYRYIFNYTDDLFDCDEMAITLWYHLNHSDGVYKNAKLIVVENTNNVGHCWVGLDTPDGWIMIETTSAAYETAGIVMNNNDHAFGIAFNNTIEYNYGCSSRRGSIIDPFKDDYDLSIIPIIKKSEYKKKFGNIEFECNMSTLQFLSNY